MLEDLTAAQHTLCFPQNAVGSKLDNRGVIYIIAGENNNHIIDNDMIITLGL